MSRNPEFYSAVFGIIKDTDWKILFQKRQNTWFADWMYQFPGWHIEWEEQCIEALIREMEEEIWIKINSKNAKLSHVSHRVRRGIRVYFDIYFEISWFEWIIKNKEPNKCSELIFLDYKKIDNIVGVNKQVLENIEQNINFSELTD